MDGKETGVTGNPTRRPRGTPRIEEEASTDRRGVFCLEGEWEDDFRSTASVEPLLRLLLDTGNATGVVHRNVATPEGLFLHLDRWLNCDEAGDYPLLYPGRGHSRAMTV
ncbi:hypothetical protein SAMN06264364_14520 [Quadrisphaera granulorum]|uniref:Uncharacterized protein n=1 Tax=Quadrisphaera granulorum TaxID=317664 RepID=A0A315ZMK3_9ACTN|nr:hypothetical protein [Quadrisphaera granulorum]PWJ46865.1 hypothetical protein BXY45_14520 [Quadrisphaera granulorum]SZE99032.1 hypothetical protein SAMN06264364_14520 [Quadrisphaera granulorum]